MAVPSRSHAPSSSTLNEGDRSAVQTAVLLARARTGDFGLHAQICERRVRIVRGIMEPHLEPSLSSACLAGQPVTDWLDAADAIRFLMYEVPRLPCC